MRKLGVTSTSTVSEPSTTATAATSFPGFGDDAAFGAGGTDGRRRGHWYEYVDNGENSKPVTAWFLRGYLSLYPIPRD